MEKVIQGVVLRRIDDSREVGGQPIRKLFESIVEASKDGYYEGTLYQAIDDEIPGRPFTRPTRHFETIKVAADPDETGNIPLDEDGSQKQQDIEVDRMEALRATNLRIEGDELLCDITISDTPLGALLLAQESAIFTMEGTYAGGVIGIIYGSGTTMPEEFVLHHIHAAVKVPVPTLPDGWADLEHSVQPVENGMAEIAYRGAIPQDAVIAGVPSGLLDAFSNLMDERAFYLNNGSIYYSDQALGFKDRPEMEGVAAVSAEDPTPVDGEFHAVTEIVEEEEMSAGAVHQMLDDYQTLASEIGGVNGKEMFDSGDMIVLGHTATDFWVFWYDNVSGNENTHNLWRVSKKKLKEISQKDKAPDFDDFIAMFLYSMRRNYEGWRGNSTSPHPIIVEVPMPIDGRYHTKSKVVPIIRRGAFMVETES